jgi:hypothetical protein
MELNDVVGAIVVGSLLGVFVALLCVFVKHQDWR